MLECACRVYLLGCVWFVWQFCVFLVGVCVCVCMHGWGVRCVCVDPGFYGMLCVCEVNFA